MPPTVCRRSKPRLVRGGCCLCAHEHRRRTLSKWPDAERITFRFERRPAPARAVRAARSAAVKAIDGIATGKTPERNGTVAFVEWTNMRIKPVLGLTLGDPAGIGPELCLGALRAPAVQERCVPVLFGDAGVL